MMRTAMGLERFDKKVALVTGASSGIGRAVAARLAEAGMRVAITARRRRGDDGHVVHISSMAAHRVPAGSGVYAATKYAVRALTEALRQELREARSNIRVSSVSPGYVHTEFAAH